MKSASWWMVLLSLVVMFWRMDDEQSSLSLWTCHVWAIRSSLRSVWIGSVVVVVIVIVAREGPADEAATEPAS